MRVLSFVPNLPRTATDPGKLPRAVAWTHDQVSTPEEDDMTEQDNAAPLDETPNLTHRFTDPNPFLSEDRTLHVAGRTAAMQRAVNATPDHTED